MRIVGSSIAVHGRIDEQRTATRAVVVNALLGLGDSDDDGTHFNAQVTEEAPVEAATAELAEAAARWLIETAANAAGLLHGQSAATAPLDPTCPADPLPWQPLEAQLYILGGLIPGARKRQ